MIVISGQIFDPAGGAAEATAPSDREYAIARALADSEETFQYAAMREFRFELLMRDSIVSAAIQLNESPAAFASFANSRCNPRYWKLTENGGFMLKEGSKPAEAIRDIFDNGHMYAFECATAVVIVLYKAVIDSLGDDVFDRLFADTYLHDWQYDKDLHLLAVDASDLIPGDIRYFKNPDVDPKKMHWQGENAVYLGNQLFFGHGIGLAGAEKIISVLNRNRKPHAAQSAYLQKRAIRPDFRYLAQYRAALPAPPFGRLRSAMPESVQQNKKSRIIAAIGSKTYCMSISGCAFRNSSKSARISSR
ncbi:MAG TPA: protein-glutamine gamma-glutamyltransferase [Bacilli bacterium]